jgi:hypothetical protein
LGKKLKADIMKKDYTDQSWNILMHAKHIGTGCAAKQLLQEAQGGK